MNGPVSKPAPSTWDVSEMRAAVAARDFGAIYAILRRQYSPYQLSLLTGQSVSDVTSVLAGRPIISYEIQLRIAQRLGLPLCVAGLASCHYYCVHEPPPQQDWTADCT